MTRKTKIRIMITVTALMTFGFGLREKGVSIVYIAHRMEEIKNNGIGFITETALKLIAGETVENEILTNTFYMVKCLWII